MSWQSLTALVVTGVIVSLIVYDLIAYAYGGNDATISRVLLSRGAAFALWFAVGIGILIGHLFLPQRVRKDDIDKGEQA